MAEFLLSITKYKLTENMGMISFLREKNVVLLFSFLRLARCRLLKQDTLHKSGHYRFRNLFFIRLEPKIKYRLGRSCVYTKWR